MIEKETFHVLNYIKKEEYTASMDGMRYMLHKKDAKDKTVLEVVIWPEPLCYSKTMEDRKQRKDFDLSTEGVQQAADWLNQQYLEQKTLWDLSKKIY